MRKVWEPLGFETMLRVRFRTFGFGLFRLFGFSLDFSDFPDFLEVMCSGAGTPEQVLLRRFNSVRKKLEYNSEDSCSRAG